MHVLAIFFLWFTVPSMSTLPDSCNFISGPERAMGYMRVMGRVPGHSNATELTRYDVHGREGQWTGWALEIDRPYFITVIAVDAAGNQAVCPSNEIFLDPATLDAPPTSPAPAQLEERCYDVAGARAWPPLRPGIYWCVRGAQRRRLVVVR